MTDDRETRRQERLAHAKRVILDAPPASWIVQDFPSIEPRKGLDYPRATPCHDYPTDQDHAE